MRNFLFISATTFAYSVGCGGTMDVMIPEDMTVVEDLMTPANDLGKLLPGSPCTADNQCAKGVLAAQTGICHEMTPGIWPDGYCSSNCRISKNGTAAPYVNSDCAGGNASCWDALNTGSTGRCTQYCLDTSECRTGYACIYTYPGGGCVPKDFSSCDPKVRNSCMSYTPDMGMDMSTILLSCFSASPGDDFGECYVACDPLGVSNCGTDYPNCHASEVNGEGACFRARGPSGMPDMGSSAGATCTSDVQCPHAYGCRPDSAMATTGKCRKYCRTGNNAIDCGVQGATCDKLSAVATVDTDVIGLCSDSN